MGQPICERRLAILTSHPIQNQAPWFRGLARHPGLQLQVFFCHNATAQDQADGGFGIPFQWDVPLLDGYPHKFLENVSRRPSVNSFAGLDTPAIGSAVAADKYDALLVCGWHYKSAWQAVAACRKMRTPVMAWGDSHLHTPRGLLKLAAKSLFYPALLRRFSACLAVGTWSKEYYLHYGVPAERVFIVPHVVDIDRFTREAGQLSGRRKELRESWGLALQDCVFLFAGKFEAKKRPLDFVHAVSLASKSGAPVAGLMAGDGPLRAECERLAGESGAPVKFTGFLNQSQIAQAYIAADALVLPSNGGETWGLVVNEAMVCGRPCIVSDRVGCGPDLVVPGKTGDLFPMGDIGALAKLMASYASDLPRLARMGQAARQAILERFSVNKAVSGVVAALQMLKGSL